MTKSFRVLNDVVDTLAYNPPGPEEGYLFWASWLNHNSANVFSTQDAHGPVRRGLVMIGCSQLSLLNLGVRPVSPQIDALSELVNFPPESEICPDNPVPPTTPPTTPPTPPPVTATLEPAQELEPLPEDLQEPLEALDPSATEEAG